MCYFICLPSNKTAKDKAADRFRHYTLSMHVWAGAKTPNMWSAKYENSMSFIVVVAMVVVVLVVLVVIVVLVVLVVVVVWWYLWW